MYLLAWIVVGAVVGWRAGDVFQGGYGPLMDICMGGSGAVVGGLVMHSVGLGGGYGRMAITTLISMVGAALLTAAAAYVDGRRIFARQL
jgi:uncharacterized membrane protein YeaQ/YmgE (transglycosylase-associated protein family)